MRAVRLPVPGVEFKMNTFDVGLPPFGHKKGADKHIWIDFFIALLPGIAFHLFEGGQLLKFGVVLGVSVVSAAVINYFKNKNYLAEILQYGVSGGLIFLMLNGVDGGKTDNIAGVGLAVLLGIIIYKLIFKSSPVTPFKPVIITPLILISYIKQSTLERPDIAIYFYLAGIVYLGVKKRISLYFILGAAAGFLGAQLFFYKGPEIYNYIAIFLISILVVSYPGVLPLRNKGRVFTGLVTGAAISVLGLLGVLGGAVLGTLGEKL